MAIRTNEDNFIGSSLFEMLTYASTRRGEETMLKSVEAIIEKNAEVHLREPIHLTSPWQAIVTILDEESHPTAETVLLSEGGAF